MIQNSNEPYLGVWEIAIEYEIPWIKLLFEAVGPPADRKSGISENYNWNSYTDNTDGIEIKLKLFKSKKLKAENIKLFNCKVCVKNWATNFEGAI